MHVRESGPLIHAQDAARARAPHGPYLDRIATTQHLPHADDSAWRRARIQPVLKPSLVHTGLMPEFFHGASPETFMNPDGSVSDSLRTTIHARVRRLPRAASLSRAPLRANRRRGRPSSARRRRSAAAPRPATPSVRRGP